MRPATIRSESEWTSTRRPVTNPVTGRRISTGRPVTTWIAMRKGVTGKEFTLISWKTETAKCRRVRTTCTLCKRRTGEATPRAAKFGRIDNSRAQSLNWDLWFGKQSQIRYRGAFYGSWKIRDETKLLGADKEAKSHLHWYFMEFGINLWSWPWNYWEVHVDTIPFKKIWDCWTAVRWIEEGTFAWLLQLTARRRMGSMMNCNYLRKIPKERRFDESVESKNFIWFVGMNITPFLFFDQLELPPIREHGRTRNTLRIRLVRGVRSLERNSFGSRPEQVDKADASEFHNVKLNAKEMISPKLVTIPKTSDGQLKIYWRRSQVLRTSTR